MQNSILYQSLLIAFILVESIEPRGIRTTGGTAKGAECKFPFTYNGTEYKTCINREVTSTNEEDDETVTYAKFCLTDDDGKWGYCMNYQDCYFPFIYDGVLYHDCITAPFGAKICSTTANFDNDQQWSYCPHVCRDFPEQSQELPVVKELSFTNRRDDSYCQFEPVLSHTTNETLRLVSTPPCKTKFYCEDQDQSVVNLIHCKLDGTFDRMAKCPSKKDTLVGSYPNARYFFKINQ